jgi:hypothetical protein
MVYCYNEKTVDVLKRGKRGKNQRFSKTLSWQVLGGRGSWACLVSVGGKEVEEEGRCLISCGWVGSKGERETKTKMRCGKGCRRVFVELWWGRGGHLLAVLHTEQTLVYACVTQEQVPCACR